MSAWSLWSSDLFDRESPPMRERTGEGLQTGLAALWHAVLHEAVQDDGRPTFTDFSLRVEGGPSARVPRDPFSNDALAQLRARRGEADFALRLAEVHEGLLGQAFSFAPFLALPVVLPAPVERVAQFLAKTLGDEEALTAHASGWRCGARVAVTRHEPPARWTVEVEGLRVTLDEGTWAHTLASEGEAASVLKDALLAAGW